MSSSPKLVTYKTDPRAGDIKAHIYSPPQTDKAVAHPIVLIFHAGGGVTGSPMMTPPAEIDYLVNTLGFVVVNAEYRLSPQVGMYEGCIADARDLLSWSRTALPSLLEVKVDTERVVAMGHSAGGHIAMTLGGAPDPPKAIMDLYGSKFLRDEWYSTPNPAFGQLPDVDREFVSRVYDSDSPVPTTTPPAFKEGKPDLTNPRFAFLFMGLKNGTQMADAVADGDLDRCDPMTMLTKDWPPTYLLHGTADIISPSELSVRAGKKLTELGVENEVALVQGKPHSYDLMGIKPGDDGWEEIRKGMDFLKKHVQ